MTFARFAAVLALTLVAPGPGAGNAMAEEPVFPLAVVGPDTVTTLDFLYELDFIRRGWQGEVPDQLPDPAAVMKRLVQNRLVVQEGYRMGLADDFSIRNQTREFIRSKAMAAMLDSVALSVPEDSVGSLSARTVAVKDFVRGLYRKYDAVVDSSLLKSLDYGSDDPEMARYLEGSEDVLVTVPTGAMKVRALTRIIRFEAFHGLVGKPNAAELRDRFFREWVEEALLTHEAKLLGFENRPILLENAGRLQENLIREKALGILLEVDFEPTEDEILAFYNDHLENLTPPARIKMESIKVGTEPIAWEVREKLEQGSTIAWLRKNHMGVVDGPAPFPYEWFSPGQLGIRFEDVAVGLIPEPYGVPGGWVVARITEIEEPQPVPLEECRTEVLTRMKSEFISDYLARVMARLEEATEITILPGAEDRIRAMLAEAVGR